MTTCLGTTNEDYTFEAPTCQSCENRGLVRPASLESCKIGGPEMWVCWDCAHEMASEDEEVKDMRKLDVDAR